MTGPTYRLELNRERLHPQIERAMEGLKYCVAQRKRVACMEATENLEELLDEYFAIADELHKRREIAKTRAALS